MKSIEQKSLKGTVLGFFSFVLNTVYSLILIPFFLTYWGDIKYGYFLSIYALIQLMRTLDNGHQIYIGNEFNKYYHTDHKKAQLILSSSVVIAFFLGFLEIVIYVILWKSGFIDKTLGIHFNKNMFLSIGILSMLAMWCMVGSIGGILARIILAKGLYPESVLFAMLLKLIEIFILCFFVMKNSEISIVFICIALATFIYSLGVFYWTYLKMPEFFPWWNRFNLSVGVRNFFRSMLITFNGFLEQMNVNGMIFLISSYLSSALVPAFTTVRTMSNTMITMTNLIIQPLIPEMIRLGSEGRKDKIWKIIETNWFFSGLMINVSFLILIPIAGFLFSIWTNGKLLFDQSLFYTLIMSVIMINFGKSLTSYLTGINDLKALTFMTCLRFVLIFGLSSLFIHKYGLISIGISIVIAELFCSGILPYYFTKRHLKDELKKSNHVFLVIISLLLMFSCLLLVNYFDNLKFLICLFSLCAIVLVYIIQWKSLDQEVKGRLIKLFRKRIA